MYARDSTSSTSFSLHPLLGGRCGREGGEGVGRPAPGLPVGRSGARPQGHDEPLQLPRPLSCPFPRPSTWCVSRPRVASRAQAAARLWSPAGALPAPGTRAPPAARATSARRSLVAHSWQQLSTTPCSTACAAVPTRITAELVPSTSRGAPSSWDSSVLSRRTAAAARKQGHVQPTSGDSSGERQSALEAACRLACRRGGKGKGAPPLRAALPPRPPTGQLDEDA